MDDLSFMGDGDRGARGIRLIPTREDGGNLSRKLGFGGCRRSRPGDQQSHHHTGMTDPGRVTQDSAALHQDLALDDCTVRGLKQRRVRADNRMGRKGGAGMSVAQLDRCGSRALKAPARHHFYRLCIAPATGDAP